MPGFLSYEEFETNEIELACERRRKNGMELLDLTSSNPTLNGYLFPEEILQAEATRYLSSRLYEPDSKGLLIARQAISAYYRSRTPALQIDPEHIVITSSTSEAYSLIFSLLCEPGDNLLAPDITYPLFEFLAAHHRIKLRNYGLEKIGRWRFNDLSFCENIDGLTRGTLVISPHNPTGHVAFERNEFLANLELPIICDEVFAEFNFGRTYTPPLGTLYPDLPVFHLNGISKMFALPDLKLGWIALNAPAYKLYGERLEILNDTFLGANGLIQHVLPALFSKGMGFVGTMRASVQAKLEKAIAILEEVPGIDVSAPDGGYYLFPKLPEGVDSEKLVLKLIGQGVLVHPGHLYGAHDEHLMISCLVKEDVLFEGIERIVSVLKSV